MITKKQYNNIKKYLKVVNTKEIPSDWHEIANNYIAAFDKIENSGIPEASQWAMLKAIEEGKTYKEFITL